MGRRRSGPWRDPIRPEKSVGLLPCSGSSLRASSSVPVPALCPDTDHTHPGVRNGLEADAAVWGERRPQGAESQETPSSGGGPEKEASFDSETA